MSKQKMPNLIVAFFGRKWGSLKIRISKSKIAKSLVI